jgi:uncharacterized DUF497 family protein
LTLIFEWDEAKARANWLKHGIRFEEAKTVFGDLLSVTIPDRGHSVEEERWIDIGRSALERILVVVYTERAGRIRLISSRLATAAERRTYEQGNR